VSIDGLLKLRDEVELFLPHPEALTSHR